MIAAFWREPPVVRLLLGAARRFDAGRNSLGCRAFRECVDERKDRRAQRRSLITAVSIAGTVALVLAGLVAYYAALTWSLDRALTARNLPEVKKLIRMGAPVRYRTRSGATPLFQAVGWPEEGAWVKELIARGADVNAKTLGESPLWMACSSGSEVGAQALLDAGADVNGAGSPTTPLMGAVGSDSRIAELLVARGAKLDSQDDAGETALMLAAFLRQRQIVRLLLKAGADSTLRDAEGRSAGDYALMVQDGATADLIRRWKVRPAPPR